MHCFSQIHMVGMKHIKGRLTSVLEEQHSKWYQVCYHHSSNQNYRWPMTDPIIVCSIIMCKE